MIRSIVKTIWVVQPMLGFDRRLSADTTLLSTIRVTELPRASLASTCTVNFVNDCFPRRRSTYHDARPKHTIHIFPTCINPTLDRTALDNNHSIIACDLRSRRGGNAALTHHGRFGLRRIIALLSAEGIWGGNGF